MTNKIILTVILAGFGAQFLKLLIYFFRHKTLHLRDLIVTGGMPSSHSAFVISLSAIIFLEEGPTTAFAISLVLAFVIVRDSFGLRRTVGEESIVISHLISKLRLREKTHISLGHTPIEVAIGSALGFLIALAVHYFF